MSSYLCESDGVYLIGLAGGVGGLKKKGKSVTSLLKSIEKELKRAKDEWEGHKQKDITAPELAVLHEALQR